MLLMLSHVELVISILLEAFVFEPGSKEIYWNMGILQSPVLKGSSDERPQLPLRISLAKSTV